MPIYPSPILQLNRPNSHSMMTIEETQALGRQSQSSGELRS